jgi:hypothetical protein
LQFTDKPRIIFGLDFLHAANIGKLFVITLASFMNNRTNTYCSTNNIQDNFDKEGQKLFVFV